MRTHRAIKKCAEWLAECLRLGWSRDQFDALEALWWQYHDDQGNLTHGVAAVVPTQQRKATDAEIQEWADRHDLGRSSITELRCIFEDAESAHLTRGVSAVATSEAARAAFELDADRRYPGIDLRNSRTADGYIHPGWDSDWKLWLRAWCASHAGVATVAPAELLRELVEADKAWTALHPVHRIHEVEKGETRLQAAWKAARAYVSGVGGTDGR